MDNWRLKHLLGLLAEDPKDEFVIYALAQEYQKLEDIENALKHYDLLKSVNPKYVGMYFHLAALYVDLEEDDLALKTYEEGIKIATEVGDQHAKGELMNAKMNWEISR